MLRLIFQLLVAMVPLGAFVAVLPPVQQRLYGGQTTLGILLLLGALALLAVLEGLLFRYWILPDWSAHVAERLYAGSYSREDDALACLVERIEREKNKELVPELAQVVRAQSWRTRGWLELARLQQELLQDSRAALLSLEQGASAVKDREDAALLMYRAARFCEQNLHDASAARSWLQRAAAAYPDTVYGRRAEALLK